MGEPRREHDQKDTDDHSRAFEDESQMSPDELTHFEEDIVQGNSGDSARGQAPPVPPPD